MRIYKIPFLLLLTLFVISIGCAEKPDARDRNKPDSKEVKKPDSDKAKKAVAKKSKKKKKPTTPATVIHPVTEPDGHRDPSPFAFQRGDTVAIIGNGLADRMQHYGWTETLLQSGAKGKELRFRNMSLTGDRVDTFPRSKGFPVLDQYLRHVKPDVVFAFFGYNESFEGAEGISDFEAKLGGLIKKLRDTKPNGEAAPRIVVFSPIAHENLKDPNLPNGKENNRRLKMYTEAMRLTSEKWGVAFVDLYGPSARLYEEQSEPLTINGIHLNEFGDRLLGEVIAESLLGVKVEASDRLSSIRETVLDKNWYWHNRYRATDGNDIWGGRSTLRFVNDQSNAEVLQHELTMLDVLTANRDPAIWAAIEGRSYQVDDSNVPAAIPVISNVGGGSKSSSADKEGDLNYKSGDKVAAKLSVPEGFEVNLFADETRFPELANPVQMQVDGKGRLWAAAWGTYPKWEPLKDMNDALLIFEDDDKDGVADRVIEFARIHNPLGFEFWNGGVLVTSMPDIWFLKDTDGDDVADIRYPIFQGIGSSDTHHSANNLIYGPDGAIYWQSGVFLQNNFEHPWGPSLISSASGMYRFDPKRYAISFHAFVGPNPHGTSFDYWGYHYATDGTGGKPYQVRPDEEGFKMHWLLNKTVRPVPSSEILSSGNFPEEMQNNFLICNAIGYLGIKNYKLHLDGYMTVQQQKQKDKSIKEVEIEYKQGEAWGTEDVDLLVSEDKNFRPTDAVVGEDGALYVSDWHNVIIGHMQHNIRDPNRDHRHGRIYRMVYTKKPLQKPVKIDGETITKLLDNLKHPVNGVRHRTRVELSERDSSEVIAGVRRWMKNFDVNDEEEAHHLLEALWVFQQHNVRNEDLLNLLLGSSVDHARIAAKTVEHHWGVADPVKNIAGGPIEQKEEKIDIHVPSHLKDADADRYALGAEVYHREAHCVTCHQESGQGMPNFYPPLAGSKWVTGDEELLTKITLHGIWGEIKVKGKTYSPDAGVPPMTAFKSLLSDEEVAAVLTYVRNTWGNKASPVEASDVAKVREATKGRSMFYKAEELQGEHPNLEVWR